MIVHVWLIYAKAGDRVYTRATAPPKDVLASYRKEGFKIFRAELHLPVEDNCDKVVQGSALPVLLCPGCGEDRELSEYTGVPSPGICKECYQEWRVNQQEPRQY